VRLVTIGEYDICACCAPHVSRTGEIGMIKLLDAVRYKGGMRIHFLAGSAALEHYRKVWTDVATLSAMLSVPQSEVVEGLKKRDAEIEKRGTIISSLRKQLLDYKIAALQETQGNFCIFTDDPEVISLALERMRFTLLCKCLQNAMDISVGVTQGYGKTTVPAIFSLVGVCGLRLLWIFSIFPCHSTVTVLFMIYPITWLITSMANLIYYFFIQHRITNLKAQGAAL
jgi:hypothetical protein